MAPDLNLLIALDALLEEGSVVGAARRMNLSPPAMSRTLARIRETVGDPIFVQAGRKMVPTPRALALRGAVRETVERASQLLAPSAEVDLRTLDKQFNVRANDIFVGTHGGRLLEEMERGMPRAMLRFTPEENDVDDDALRSGRIDLFISASRRLGPEIRVQPLFTTAFVGLARSDHPIFDDHITPERFARWPHIGVSRRGKSSGPIDAALGERGLKRRVALVVPTPYAAVFALQASDLILPLPEHLALGAMQAGLGVRTFELPVPLETVLITQAWHPRFQSDPAHQWLRRVVRGLCTGMAALQPAHA
ncbi:LysR family transcriptional regulator [Burkholderia thailandensis]|uniref:LysR substrate binding domain protein n=1 Tax=Burkholderia thailandensis TaxID=57975 RepID=A0AAW9CUE8_BURTH|nr:LysR family transcriptional regulator [Burkholderia thailandensis]AHI68048.1 bacterial regulatory helix-turn-helix, lysR family protein [Burkholderia thailandensis H0587]AIP66778.1 LysR family transcriptional regulator [Burkholderia thailandensis]AJY32104.1 bacterial regulatory helix-turn-helix, lysR family protein [Burkholderia thailandensis 34]AOI55737.1 LysR family transcriptional regulator [Burkholderia thailandensis]AOJ54702.1 LysR family transcriptional regulator [Burkholderia thailan